MMGTTTRRDAGVADYSAGPPAGGADRPNDQRPLPYRVAAPALGRCVARTVRLLADRRIHLLREHVGWRLRFAGGTSACVYRETIVDRAPPAEPCVLVVAFRLRAVRGWGHILFRWESLLNTTLFVGFPGYVSKLWLANDERDVYRGVYQWDGPGRAEHYARSLWRVLALGSVPGSIHYQVLPGLWRDDLLAQPRLIESSAPDGATAWWRVVEVTCPESPTS